MKRRGIVFFVVVMVILGACSAQMANAQSTNIAQKIIGTWTEQNVKTWVFNANGTLTLTTDDGEYKFAFAVTDTKLAMIQSGSNRVIFYDISISSDGKTLILISFEEKGLGAYNNRWLTKK